MLKRIIAAIVASGFLAGLAGCNTIQGAGKDVERAGEKVQDTAQRAKDKM